MLKTKHNSYYKFEDGRTMDCETFNNLYVRIKWATYGATDDVKSIGLFVWNKNYKAYHSDWDYYILKEKFHKLKKVPPKYERLGAFLGYVIMVDNICYAEDLNLLKDVLQDHKAYVVKDTNWPYFFKVNGQYIKSGTSNWFKYLHDSTGFVSSKILEEYHGPDMEKKHEHK